MKTTKWVIAILIAMVFLAGCGSTPVVDNNDTNIHQPGDDNGTQHQPTPEEINAKKVRDFEQNKTIVQILTGVDLKLGATKHSDGNSSEMFGGWEQAYFDGGKMVKGNMPCEYFYQPGYRGTIAEDSGIPGHWDYYRIDYSAEEGSEGLEPVTYLNHCSSGLYDLIIWNININPSDYVRYNKMMQTKIYDLGDRKYVLLSNIYNENWNGTENDRTIYNPGLVLYMTGDSGFYTASLFPDHKIEKIFLEKYSVKVDNHLGLPVDTVLENCILSKITENRNIGKDENKGVLVQTTVCENYGLLELNATVTTTGF